MELLREQEEAIRDCEAEWIEDLNYEIMLLNDVREEEQRGIEEERDAEFEQFLMEKATLLAPIKKERRRISTGVLCSEGVATLIAEFACGEYGRRHCWWLPEELRTLYCFAIAIRADGYKWPYLTFAAMTALGLWRKWNGTSNKIKLAPYRQVARSIIGEFARLDDAYVQAEETGRILTMDDCDFEDLEKAGDVLYSGIKKGGLVWFRGVYLPSPLFCPKASAKWKARIF